MLINCFNILLCIVLKMNDYSKVYIDPQSRFPDNKTPYLHDGGQDRHHYTILFWLYEGCPTKRTGVFLEASELHYDKPFLVHKLY